MLRQASPPVLQNADNPPSIRVRSGKSCSSTRLKRSPAGGITNGIRPLRTQCHLACRSSGLLSRVVAQCFVAALGASLWLSSNGEGGPYLLHDSLHDPVLYIPSRLVSLFRLYYGIMTLRTFLAFSLSLIHFLLAAAFLIFLHLLSSVPLPYSVSATSNPPSLPSSPQSQSMYFVCFDYSVSSSPRYHHCKESLFLLVFSFSRR